LNARNEEEVDTQLIIDKVAKSKGSAYSFKERGDQGNEMGPVVSKHCSKMQTAVNIFHCCSLFLHTVFINYVHL
jgi:hypothetical protein